MSSHVIATEELTHKEHSEERISTDAGSSPKWFEYLRFMAVVSVIAGAVLIGPMVGMLAVSLVVTMFGWMAGALSF